jgi:tRNA pseudouridine38-40 synthase
MTQRLKLVVAYDGSHFAGWQSQTHGNGVQDHLERAFATVTGVGVRVHGAGRTDAGVHALGQSAHADISAMKLSVVKWRQALNANLPPQLRVLACAFVRPDFHARYSARGKVYRYRVWTGPVLPPFEFNRAWHFPRQLDFDRLKCAAGYFIGRHDFAGFAATRGKVEHDTVRVIRAVNVRRHGFSWMIEFDGDGFLYKMVRLMVGSLIDCASGRHHESEIVRQLLQPRHCARRLAAPAEGLYLIRVRY